MTYRFAFRSGYMNCSWFDVFGDGETYSVRYRHCLDDYEASIHNAGPDAYRAQQGPLVGLLMREHCYKRPPIPVEVVRAFNDWRCTEAAKADAHFAKYSERYGVQPPTNPRLATGSAHYADGYEFYPLDDAMVMTA